MRALIIIIALLFTGPALAGVRATYVDGSNPAKLLVIETSDDGNARIAPNDSSDFGLLLDGQFYMIGKVGEQVRVARIEDIAKAIDGVIPPIFKNLLGAAGAAAVSNGKIRVEQKGDRTIAGLTGQAYAVYGLDQSKPSSPTLFVMSSDPRLQPVGEAMAGFINAAVLPMAALLGDAAADMVRETRMIFALGAPLDAGGKYRLQKLETVDMGPERFRLPTKPSTVDELIVEMKSQMIRPAQ